MIPRAIRTSPQVVMGGIPISGGVVSDDARD
jgi:hypothetical protein